MNCWDLESKSTIRVTLDNETRQIVTGVTILKRLLSPLTSAYKDASALIVKRSLISNSAIPREYGAGIMQKCAIFNERELLLKERGKWCDIALMLLHLTSYSTALRNFKVERRL